MKILLYSLFILSLFSTLAVFSQVEPNAVYLYENFGSSKIYWNSDTIDFKNKISEYKYNSFECFLNKSNCILYSERNYSLTNGHKTLRSSYLFLATYDKTVIDTIYSFKKNEKPHRVDISKDDSILFIVLTDEDITLSDSCKYDKNEFLFIDIKTKREIKRIKLNSYSSCCAPCVGDALSPKGNYFIYSKNDCQYATCNIDTFYCGIHIINIQTGVSKQISKYGRRAVWSPKNDYIAYSRKDGIWLYNLKTKEHQLFYKIKKKKQRISDIKWTPNGNSLYFQIRTKRIFHIGGVMKPYLKNIKTGELNKAGFLYKYGMKFQWK